MDPPEPLLVTQPRSQALAAGATSVRFQADGPAQHLLQEKGPQQVSRRPGPRHLGFQELCQLQLMLPLLLS